MTDRTVITCPSCGILWGVPDVENVRMFCPGCNKGYYGGPFRGEPIISVPLPGVFIPKKDWVCRLDWRGYKLNWPGYS